MLALLASTLSGCSGTVQDRLGVGNRPPDEFQVVRRAPLVLPPDYNLRPPGQVQGAVRSSTSDDAREIVTGRAAEPAPGQSAGERALLASVGVESEPGIRERLLAENTELTQLDESRFLFILDFQRDALTYSDAVIDPDEESARLDEEGAARRVVTRRVSSRVVTEPEGG